MHSSRDGQSAEYGWAGSAPAHNHAYLAPGLLEVLGSADGRRLLDMGCGNGSLSSRFSRTGFVVTGLESSSSGVGAARASFPDLTFHLHDLNQELPREMHEAFDVVVAAEVIEHLFLPRLLFRRASEALSANGVLVLSTPFHGYWKNLAMALTNKFDEHWRPSWDYGHIKFFSVATLTRMAEECGFTTRKAVRVGRVPALAKSMIFAFDRDA